MWFLLHILPSSLKCLILPAGWGTHLNMGCLALCVYDFTFGAGDISHNTLLKTLLQNIRFFFNHLWLAILETWPFPYDLAKRWSYIWMNNEISFALQLNWDTAYSQHIHVENSTLNWFKIKRFCSTFVVPTLPCSCTPSLERGRGLMREDRFPLPSADLRGKINNKI